MKQIIQTISLILLLGACTDETYTDTLLSQGSKSGELVSVELALNIQPMQSPPSADTKAGGDIVSSTEVCKGMEISLVKTPVTRATYEDEIKNFWVLQFDNINPDGKLVYKNNCTSVKGVQLVQLVIENQKSKIIVIANASEHTFDNLSIDQTTLADFNALGISSDQNGFPLFYDAAGNRPIFAGSTNTVVAANKQADIMLYRTVARVNVTLTLSQSMIEKNYQTWTYQFIQIPKKSFYYSIGQTAVFPEETVGYTNYKQQPITFPSNAPITTYLPVNFQHSVPYTSPEKRRVNAPVGATYLQIVGVQMAGNVISRSVIYQIHMGSNFTDNYSVSPNYSYTYDIHITNENIDDSRVIKFIPGYFGGKLTMYNDKGVVTQTPGDASIWRYEKRNEVYISDVNPSGGIKWLNSGSMPATPNSLMDGRQNTWDLRQSTDYPAIAGCVALNGATLPPNIEAMTWYTPSFGQSLAIYVGGSNTLQTLPNTYYWSSTANGTYAWGIQVWTGQSPQLSPNELYNLRCIKDLNLDDAIQ